MTLTAICVVYVVSIMVVTRPGPMPMGDDWIYSNTALTFSETGSVVTGPISLPLSVFEAVYGGVFISAVGSAWSGVILASAVLAAVSAIALFDIVWRAGAAPVVSLLVVLAYLFAPLLYALNSSFMTDGHAIALAVIAAALFSRALDRVPPSYGLLVVGGIITTVGFLSRPSVIFVVIGPLLAALTTRNLAIALASATGPVAVAVAFLAFRQPVGASAMLLEQLAPPDFASVAGLGSLAIVEIGIGLVAFAGAASGAAWSALRRSRIALLWGIVAAVALLLVALPAIPADWLTNQGVYPIDSSMIGERPNLAPGIDTVAVPVVVAVIVACGLIIAGSAKWRLTTAEVSLLAMAAGSVGLTAISLASSSGALLDRYVVVFLPAAILFTASRMPQLKRTAAISGLVVATLVAALSIGLALDGRRLHGHVFDVASNLVDTGIAQAELLDAGASWVSVVHGPSVTADSVTLPVRNTPWWHNVFASGVDFRWVVSLNTDIPGCEIDRIRHHALIGPDVEIVVTDTECEQHS